jgi:hypothetical protein
MPIRIDGQGSGGYVCVAHPNRGGPYQGVARLSKKVRRRPPAAPEPGRHVVVPRRREWIDPELTWHALWCRANRERHAAEALSKVGIAAYRPLEARRVLRRGVPATVERTPVGRYLFAGLPPNRHFRAIRRALEPPERPRLSFTLVDEDGAYSLSVRPYAPDAPHARLMQTKAGPVVVPAPLLQAFADAVTLHGVEARPSPFAAGQRVRVTNGPFEGLSGLVEHVEDSRVRGLVELFGRLTPVEFEPEQLEAA